MKNNDKLLNIILAILSCIPIIYLTTIWKDIPERIPLHFNTKLQPDRFGNKSELWIISAFLVVVCLSLQFLLQKRLQSHKKNTHIKGPFVNIKMTASLILLITILHLMFLTATYKGATVLDHFGFPLIGLMLALIGNYMNNIKPNYFAGFRLPWTLHNEENWRKTHRLAGPLWFWSGLVLVLISVLLPSKTIFPIFISVVIAISLIPIIYSYKLTKKNKNL